MCVRVCVEKVLHVWLQRAIKQTQLNFRNKDNYIQSHIEIRPPLENINIHWWGSQQAYLNGLLQLLTPDQWAKSPAPRIYRTNCWKSTSWWTWSSSEASSINSVIMTDVRFHVDATVNANKTPGTDGRSLKSASEAPQHWWGCVNKLWKTSSRILACGWNY